MAAPVPTNATFLASYPEFERLPATVGAAFLTRKLTEASVRTNPNVYETPESCELAVMLRAAILLSLCPDARKMRLVTDEQAFIWKTQLVEMQRAATQGMRIF